MASVIIPVHNESAVVSATLQHLLSGLPDTVEIIAVCNGCNDNSAMIIREFSRVKLIETAVASKTAALNLGDAAATQFPRIYMDADIRLPSAAITQIQAALSAGLLAVSPSVEMDMDGCSWAVRAYYDIWLQLPYSRLGMMGSGTYALGEQGRARFDKFPDIIADDGFVRASFTEEERGAVEASAIVRAPANLRNLIKIKTRSRLGRYELRSKFPELMGNEQKQYGSAIRELIFKPLLWPRLLVYLYVNLLSRFRARSQLARGKLVWERDDSRRGG